MDLYYTSSMMTPYAGEALFFKLKSLRHITYRHCKRFEASSLKNKDFAIFRNSQSSTNKLHMSGITRDSAISIKEQRHALNQAAKIKIAHFLMLTITFYFSLLCPFCKLDICRSFRKLDIFLCHFGHFVNWIFSEIHKSIS